MKQLNVGLFLALFAQLILAQDSAEVKFENFKAVNPSFYDYQKKMIKKAAQDFPNESQISIAIVQNDSTYFYGIQLTENGVEWNQNEDKVFEIGSISKIFTASILAELVNQNKIGLEDSIQQYFSTPFYNNQNIELLQLANHSSGLPKIPTNYRISDFKNPFKDYSKENLNNYLGELLEINDEEKDWYQYSNLGYAVLAQTLVESQQKDYESLLKELVVAKYNLHNTTSDIDETYKNLVCGLNSKGEIVDNWEMNAFLGSSGIFSSTQDLAQFAVEHFKLDNKALQLTLQPTKVNGNGYRIGLGWHILNNSKNQNLYWHNGSTAGYYSQFLMNPEKKNAVIILSNVSGRNQKAKKLQKLSFDILARLDRL